MRTIVLASFLLFAPDTIGLDFSRPELPAGFSIGAKGWAVADGMLRGKGAGELDYAGPISADFDLRFKAWTAEKANVEVKLFDAKSDAELYTFAFLGQYHAALDGVKSCILRDERFVTIDARMWIFPGRTFDFEVRAAKGQFQMFLNGELGPFFVDPAPLVSDAGIKLKILVSTEGKSDEVRLDDVELKCTPVQSK